MKEYSLSGTSDFRSFTQLPELSLPISPNSEESSVGPLFHNWERIETNNGDNIYVAPTCEVSRKSLIPENWGHVSNLTHFRHVFRINTLRDGTQPHVVVKSPQHIYTRDQQKLSRGDVWWGGTRAWDKSIDMKGNPVIEAQVEREAIVLFALREAGIPAELPQAMITRSNGTRQLVVREIQEASQIAERGFTYQISRMRAGYYGFVIENAASDRNFIFDDQGNDVLIGVNRWQIPPHTDSYQQELVTTLTEATGKKNTEKETTIFNVKKPRN